jgi:hypothetical protein
LGKDGLVNESLKMFEAIITVLLREKLVCTAPGVSLNESGKRTFTYCHAMSMSKVGTKKEVGAEAMRSRNLIQRGRKRCEPLSPSVPHIRVVSGNTMVQGNHILFAVKKSWLAPTKLMHLLRERALSEDLMNVSVSPRKERSELQKLTALTRSTENGRSSLYALRTLLSLTRGNGGSSLSALML